MDLLKQQKWRGNIRELKNFIQRLIVHCPDEIISEELVKKQLKQFTCNDNVEDFSVEGL